MVFNINWDTSTNKDLLKSLLRKLFMAGEDTALVEYKEIFNDLKTSDYYERDERIAGLRGMQEIGDGQAIPLDDPEEGQQKTYTQARFGLGFRITAGMKKFNKWNLMQKFTKNLSKVMKESKDIEIAKMFNNATSATAPGKTGYDGLAIASNSHTTLGDDGYTYDNYLDAALGYATLQSAIIYFDDLIDDRGFETPGKPSLLVVDPNLRFTAEELLRSDLKPGSGDNDINVLKGDLRSFVYHRSSSSTAWAVLDKGNDDYDLNVFTSQEPNLIVKDAPDLTEDTVVLSSQWFTYGVGDPRRFYLGNS